MNFHCKRSNTLLIASPVTAVDKACITESMDSMALAFSLLPHPDLEFNPKEICAVPIMTPSRRKESSISNNGARNLAFVRDQPADKRGILDLNFMVNAMSMTIRNLWHRQPF